jgi:dTMP kinase
MPILATLILKSKTAMINNSKFISFEGLDFSGKTTQVLLLKEKLEMLGETVLLLREPGGTPISERIRNILLDKNHLEMTDICEILLYSAARHQLVSEKIIKVLESGNFVIADRYVDSTTAYQGYGRRIPMDFVKKLNHIATAGLLPGLTFYLNLELSELKNRISRNGGLVDRLESGGDKFYQRIYKGYLKIADHEKERFTIIDAGKKIEKIHNEIWEYVRTKLNLKRQMK